jgi:hypothetical protein
MNQKAVDKIYLFSSETLNDMSLLRVQVFLAYT